MTLETTGAKMIVQKENIMDESALRRAVTMKITGTIFDQDQREENLQFITEGDMYRKGDDLYLIYDEGEMEGFLGCKIRLKISDDAVKMKRFGESIGVDTEISFEKGKRFTGFYDTPMGPIEMEVLTNDIKNSLKFDEPGNLNIDYVISLKGLFTEARNKLDIQVTQM